MKQTLTITEEDGVVRVDKYLAHKFPEYSRAALAKLFDLNLIKLQGVPIQAGHKLRPHTTFEYDLGPLQAKPEVIPLPILYEDTNVLVVNKPSGIISHARGKFWQEASVASFIRDKLKDIEGDRGGIVHRLDRATSGVMICAKNEATLSFLQTQFSKREVEKTYIALIKGVLDPQHAIIDAPIGRDIKTPKKFHVTHSGKSAQTEYTILKTSIDGISTVELKPRTGRTHQLRVHLQYMKHPIIGDELYDGPKANRLMLHAKSLQISIPERGMMHFEAPLPEEFDEMGKNK
jgi:23S rRNA pseudouridine1911/1915/1917 synthase